MHAQLQVHHVRYLEYCLMIRKIKTLRNNYFSFLSQSAKYCPHENYNIIIIIMVQMPIIILISENYSPGYYFDFV